MACEFRSFFRWIVRRFFCGLVWIFLCYTALFLGRQQETAHYVNSVHRGLLQHPLQRNHSVHYPSTLNYTKAPKVDTTSTPLDSALLNLLSKNSNIPIAYWMQKAQFMNQNESCDQIPNIYDLDFNNVYWQRFTSSTSATFYLYASYYDNRTSVGQMGVVRIISMVNRRVPPLTYCQLWFYNKEDPLFSIANYTYMWYDEWGNSKDGMLQPYLITCPVPETELGHIVPASVSLVEYRCTKPSNSLKVIYNQPSQKQEFAVCVKGLDFLNEDLSVRLVEWIELLFLLGARKIFFYELEVHPNISKVLNYYRQKGWIHSTPITLPGNQPNLIGFRHLYLKSRVMNKRQNELIPYNDCLYQNLYSYEYLVLLDIDEVILPLQHLNWSELMKQVVDQSVKETHLTHASYNVRNVYFLDDLQGDHERNHSVHVEGIPPYLHMLQHVYRSKNFTKPGYYVKCFHRTDRVVSLHNHLPKSCFDRCTTYAVNISLAQMNHYRKDCVDNLVTACKSDFRNFTVKDTSIWRYKEMLVKRTTDVLTELGFFQ